MVRLVDGRGQGFLDPSEIRQEPRPIEELSDPRSRAIVRMNKYAHKATLFEQEELRLPNGDYRPDAPELLHKFWLQFGLHLELEQTGQGDLLAVRLIRCVEDIS